MMRYESDSDDGIMGSLVPTTMQSREQILPVSSTISASFEGELILQKNPSFPNYRLCEKKSHDKLQKIFLIYHQ